MDQQNALLHIQGILTIYPDSHMETYQQTQYIQSMAYLTDKERKILLKTFKAIHPFTTVLISLETNDEPETVARAVSEMTYKSKVEILPMETSVHILKPASIIVNKATMLDDEAIYSIPNINAIDKCLLEDYETTSAEISEYLGLVGLNCATPADGYPWVERSNIPLKIVKFHNLLITLRRLEEILNNIKFVLCWAGNKNYGYVILSDTRRKIKFNNDP